MINGARQATVHGIAKQSETIEQLRTALHMPSEPCYKIFFFFFDHKACGILVSLPGIKPTPPAVEAQSLNH